MSVVIIKISYRHIIDASAQTAFEKNVLHSSYKEFLLKCQAYNPEGKFKTFSELKANDGRANSLHYKSGFAVGGFIETLNKKIPFLEDNSGKAISFDTCNFGVIESDITDQLKHIIVLHFTSPEFILQHSFGDYLVLSEKGKEDGLSHETFTLQLQPNLSIVYYEEKN